LERDKNLRIGAASFESYTDNPFFQTIDFAALERKELDPIFKPSSDKTNFDATYDLEELLLEEAPLEARARRQKPREQLKVDATRAEIRADELHRMIEKLFEPFDYTLQQYDKGGMISPGEVISATTTGTGGTVNQSPSVTRGTSPIQAERSEFESLGQKRSTGVGAPSPNGSPPLPSAEELPTSFPFQGGAAQELETALPTIQKSRSDQHKASSSKRKGRSSKRGVNDPLRTGDSATDGESGYPLSGSSTARSIEEAGKPGKDGRPSGMLAFLSRNKKGRDKSPSSGGGFGGHKEKERGVLGKAGARAVVNS
jgi:serine/threonine kinase 32